MASKQSTLLSNHHVYKSFVVFQSCPFYNQWETTSEKSTKGQLLLSLWGSKLIYIPGAQQQWWWWCWTILSMKSPSFQHTSSLGTVGEGSICILPSGLNSMSSMAMLVSIPFSCASIRIWRILCDKVSEKNWCECEYKHSACWKV